MPDISTTTIFSTGQTVTAAIMNSIISNSTIQPTFVTTKPIVTTLANADVIFGANAAGTQMQQISYSNLLAQILAVPQIASGTQFGSYNAIVNGDMNIARRPASVSIAATGYTQIDKWKWELAGTASRATVAQNLPTTIATLPWVTPGLSAPISLKVTVPSATGSVAIGDFQALTQIIENCYFAPLANGAMSLSFLYKTNFSGNLSISLRDQANGFSYIIPFATNGDGAYHLAQFPNITMPTASGAWQLGVYGAASMKLTVTFLAGTTFQTATTGSWTAGNFMATNTQGNFFASASNTFEITQVMLNPGTVCLPFIEEDISKNLAKCARYFGSTFPLGVTPAQSLSRHFLGGIWTGASTCEMFGRLDYQLRTLATTFVGYNPFAANNAIRDRTASTGPTVTINPPAGHSSWGIETLATSATTINDIAAFCYTADADF